MENNKVIVTIAIGVKHFQLWKKYAESSWKKYAEKYGYDIICFTEVLDKSERAQKRSVAWQKCLILGDERVRKYERVVWLDSDIIINYFAAPCIVSQVQFDKVGAVKAWNFYTVAIYEMIHERMKSYAIKHKLSTYEIGKQYFTDYGLSPISEDAVQTGVLVLNREFHRQLLEKVYYEYEDNRTASWHYEMRPLSYEIICNDMPQWIDNRFNFVVENLKAYQYFHHYPKNYLGRIRRGLKIKCFHFLSLIGIRTWEEELVINAINNGFFIHFAGNAKEMVFAKNVLTSD